MKDYSASVQRTGIIDIGSNSIRLVVYEGPARLPAILFNEKVMAGLGKGLTETGAIDPEALDRAEVALERFAALAREMGIERTRTVATAAVREASNGQQLIDRARAIGLFPEVLTGEQEALAAGMGVLSAIPQADGIVGDLGGGSLELVRVYDGRAHERVSFPIGVLRAAAIRRQGKGTLGKTLRVMMEDAGWLGRGEGKPLYMVGGSWRSLARLEMHFANYPLPVVHEYVMTAERVTALTDRLAGIESAKLDRVPNLSRARVPTLGDASALLGGLLRCLGSTEAIVSAYGLREGLLFAALDDSTRATDPLIVAARDEGRRSGRFAEHGDLLDRWIAPLFDKDPEPRSRLRHVACLLADVGWRANPEFRAERGMEIALHGNWVAIDAEGRALVAQALWTSLGGDMGTPEPIRQLASPEALQRAVAWGLAMRLGQRLSGGVAGPLERSLLSSDETRVLLELNGQDRALYGEAVERRHRTLAQAVGRKAVLV